MALPFLRRTESRWTEDVMPPRIRRAPVTRAPDPTMRSTQASCAWVGVCAFLIVSKPVIAYLVLREKGGTKPRPHAQWVEGRVGFEPTTRGLKVPYQPISRRSGKALVEPRFCSFRSTNVRR